MDREVSDDELADIADYCRGRVPLPSGTRLDDILERVVGDLCNARRDLAYEREARENDILAYSEHLRIAREALEEIYPHLRSNHVWQHQATGCASEHHEPTDECRYLDIAERALQQMDALKVIDNG